MATRMFFPFALLAFVQFNQPARNVSSAQVASVHFNVSEKSESFLDYFATSQLDGYIQSKGFSRDSTYPMGNNVHHTVSAIGPLDHVVMISVIAPANRECHYERVELYIGGPKNASRLAWRLCYGRDTGVELYYNHMFHVHWVMQKTVNFVTIDGDARGFRLRFSFHKKTSALPHKLPGGLWNCSVPNWSEFQTHFRCNYDTECALAEDETDCPYTGHCKPGQFTADRRCYVYVNPRRNITWLEANMACRDKYGGHLASLNTPTEWSSVILAMQLSTSYTPYFVGLKNVGSGKPHIYRGQYEWADGSMALYYLMIINFGDVKSCGQLTSPGVMYITVIDNCHEPLRRRYICETRTVDRKRGSQRAMENMPDDSANQTLPFPHVRCPRGHVTHTFLACDAKSSCFSRTYVSSVGTVLSSCRVQLQPELPSFACTDGFERVPYSLVCDYRRDCLDNSDEDFCVFAPCAGDTPSQCANSKQCMSRDMKCNDQIDCVDGSDELDCTNSRSSQILFSLPPPALVFVNLLTRDDTLVVKSPHRGPCPQGYFRCSEGGYCFELQFRCNGVNDCPGGEDEAACAEYTCPGMYRCRGSKICLGVDRLCDGIRECPQSDDELFCDLKCPSNCTCYGMAFTCPQSFAVKEFLGLRYLDSSGSGLTPQHLEDHTMLVHLSLARCGLLYLGNVTFPNLRSLDLSDNKIYSVTIEELRRLNNLQILYLSSNPLASVFVSDTQSDDSLLLLRFLDLSRVALSELSVRTQLPNLQHLNLSDTGLDHLRGRGFRSLTNLRVLDLRGCPMSRFPRQIFKDLHQLQAVYADSFRVCCPSALPAGFNINKCQAPEDSTSSCERLLKNVLHVVFVSLFTITTVLGNSASFALRVLVNKNSNKSAFDVLLSHLCVSDFVMGVYLAIIGLADRLYQGTYLWEDITWRHSVTCKVASFLFLLSSEVSTFLVCCITVERFVALRFPTTGLRLTTKSAHLASLASWLLGLVLAVVPLLVSEWKMSTQSGICIPLPFTRTSHGLVYFNGVIITLLFILHLMVAPTQTYIYWKTRTDFMATLKPGTRSSEASCARRVLPMVTTDCLCRILLGLLDLLVAEGSSVSSQGRVTVAVVVLPLTAALHPLLYTYGVLRERSQRARHERLLKYLMAKRRAKGLNA